MRDHESIERIKTVSMKLFNNKGYEATTIRDICSQIGITAPSFYYYFDSKEQLYLQLMQESGALHQSTIAKAMDDCPGQTTEDRLKYAFMTLLQLYREQPEAYTFLLRNTFFPVATMKGKTEEDSNWYHQFSEQIAGFIGNGQKLTAPKMNQMALVRGYHRFVVGYVLQLISGVNDNSDAVAEEAWNQYWNGIK